MKLAEVQLALDSLGYKKNPIVSILSQYEFADTTARDTYFTTNYSELKKNKTYIYIEATSNLEVWNGDTNPASYDNSNWKDVSLFVRGLKGDKGDTGSQGIQGLQGIQGEKGDTGDSGTNGVNGSDGEDGREIEIQKGLTHIQWRYSGDIAWNDLVALADLKGDQGIQGESGQDGVDGINGANGTDGSDGDSAYQTWLDLGNVGTEQDFIDSLKGDQGIQGIQGEPGQDGTDGVGVPAGGTTGQILKKKSDSDYDTDWEDETTSGSGIDELERVMGVKW